MVCFIFIAELVYLTRVRVYIITIMRRVLKWCVLMTEFNRREGDRELLTGRYNPIINRLVQTEA